MQADVKYVPGLADEYGWRQPPRQYLLGLNGYFNPARRSLLRENRKPGPPLQAKILAWMRDHLHQEIPRAYYRTVLGHDLHVAVWGELYVRHYHAQGTWWENVGRVSVGKVTTAFRDFESGCLVTDQTTYGDFKFHEVGLSNTAEANTQTALLSTTGIARYSGDQTNPSASTYQSVGLLVADTNETWAEHGIFNALTAGVLLDRSVLSPAVTVQVGDSVQFTYVLTKSAEP